jgi:hypothetical protein
MATVIGALREFRPELRRPRLREPNPKTMSGTLLGECRPPRTCAAGFPILGRRPAAVNRSVGVQASAGFSLHDLNPDGRRQQPGCLQAGLRL